MVQDNGFVFGSWNAGSTTSDYTQLIHDRSNASDRSPNLEQVMRSENPEDRAMIDSIGRVRNKLLGEVAKDLAHAADVYALQEVSGDDRSDIQEFKKQGFEIIRPQKNSANSSETDTAIAIHRNKFKNIENRSFIDFASGTDFAIAIAKEKATGKKISFISSHIAGFNLEEKDEVLKKEQAICGDSSIEHLISKLRDICSDCDSVIIGADMNASPEIYAQRFNLFANEGAKQQFFCKI